MNTGILSPFTLPDPAHTIDDATVWDHMRFPDDRTWVHALTDPMRDEIRSATRQAIRSGIAPEALTPDTFPLACCGEVLDALYDEVENQHGFAMVEGFLFEDFNELELRTAYAGFCSHMGTITVQNRDEEYLLEVTNKGKGYDQSSRGYHSNKHLDFHNDGTNTVSLLCVQTAAEGGLSKLVSGPAVYNEIAKTRPDLLDPLLKGFHHHKRDQLSPGDDSVTPYRTPVFSFRDGVFHMAYAGPSILYCEQEGVEISDLEKEALSHLESILEQPEMHIHMELRRGDIQFVNNYVVLHARTEYRDEPGQVRRLLRLWLDDEGSKRIGPGKMDWYMPMQSRYTLLTGLPFNA